MTDERTDKRTDERRKSLCLIWDFKFIYLFNLEQADSQISFWPYREGYITRLLQFIKKYLYGPIPGKRGGGEGGGGEARVVGVPAHRTLEISLGLSIVLVIYSAVP